MRKRLGRNLSSYCTIDLHVPTVRLRAGIIDFQPIDTTLRAEPFFKRVVRMSPPKTSGDSWIQTYKTAQDPSRNGTAKGDLILELAISQNGEQTKAS